MQTARQKAREKTMAIYAVDFDNTLAVTRFPEIVGPKAKVVAGRIYEKEAAGCITPGHKQDLINILYTKYETIRGLESWGAGCGL